MYSAPTAGSGGAPSVGASGGGAAVDYFAAVAQMYPMPGTDPKREEIINARPGSAAWQTSWPEWRAKLELLGVPEIQLQLIAKQIVTDSELRNVYQQISGTMYVSAPPRYPATNGWSPQWEQQFALLGLAPDKLALVAQAAQERGLTDANLAQAFQDTAKQLAATTPLQSVPDPAQAVRFPGGGAGTKPADVTKPGADAPTDGVDPALEADVKQLLATYQQAGMPDELLSYYGQSFLQASAEGAPITGLEAALKTAVEREQKFTEDGYRAKFEKAGLSDGEIWRLALGDPSPGSDTIAVGAANPSNKDLDYQLVMLQRAKAGTGRNFAEAALSLVPGVQALEYLAGKNVITGSDIRQDETGNKLLAGLSAIAGVGIGILGLRKGRGFAAGFRSAGEGFANLKAVPGAVMGEGTAFARLTQNHSASRLLSTQGRRDLIAAGQVDRAAAAFRTNGNKLDETTQAVTTQRFRDLASGELQVRSARLNLFSWNPGRFNKVKTDAKTGQETLLVNQKLGGDDNTKLVSLIHEAGSKAGRSPEWLLNAAKAPLTQTTTQIARTGSEQRGALGEVMARRAVHELGGIGTSGRTAKALSKLTDNGTPPQYYSDIAAATRRDLGVS